VKTLKKLHNKKDKTKMAGNYFFPFVAFFAGFAAGFFASGFFAAPAITSPPPTSFGYNLCYFFNI
jgi:uncharacterized membrane protein YfcA